MSSNGNKHLVRGVLAGIAGGLAASWVMNEFSETAGKRLSKAVESPEEQKQIASKSDGEDATMKAADRIAATATGGQHLTHEQRETGGPIVHYSFGALMGGVYGGLAELVPATRAGFGTTFGAVLFAAADLFAVPALHLAPSATELPASAEAAPLAGHLVYGATTELVRRLVRAAL
jgi:putative membrane protein